ncbi:hypothetical protein V6N13_046390 [Hibiscus sabdariffa]
MLQFVAVAAPLWLLEVVLIPVRVVYCALSMHYQARWSCLVSEVMGKGTALKAPSSALSASSRTLVPLGSPHRAKRVACSTAASSLTFTVSQTPLFSST